MERIDFFEQFAPPKTQFGLPQTSFCPLQNIPLDPQLSGAELTGRGAREGGRVTTRRAVATSRGRSESGLNHAWTSSEQSNVCILNIAPSRAPHPHHCTDGGNNAASLAVSASAAAARSRDKNGAPPGKKGAPATSRRARLVFHTPAAPAGYNAESEVRCTAGGEA